MPCGKSINQSWRFLQDLISHVPESLRELGSGVIRRLSGIKVETSAIYNLTTQFGGGKTHALTLLYHLAEAGPAASNWKGVQSLLDKAGVQTVPGAATAVFVGTEFDSLTGRGGKDGTPLRRTPWGDIAFQLGGEEGFAVVAKHDAEGTAPSTEVIRKFLPKGKPALILMEQGCGHHHPDYRQEAVAALRGQHGARNTVNETRRTAANVAGIGAISKRSR